MSLPGPRAVLFDWDNTLVDGWVAIAAALNVVFARRGMPGWSVAEAQANVRGSARDSFPAMFGQGWEQDLALFYEAFRRDHLAHVQPMPGAATLLDTLHPWPCAVVSNKAGAFLRREVTHLGWDRYFDALVGAGDAAADKPDAAPVLMALQMLGLQPGIDIWYVGDTALDMQAARAAGCHAVLLGDAAHDGGLDRARPDRHFASAHQLAIEMTTLAP